MDVDEDMALSFRVKVSDSDNEYLFQRHDE